MQVHKRSERANKRNTWSTGEDEIMRSLEIIEELNKILIDAKKRVDIVYEEVGECDKARGDFEHDLLNEYSKLSAKDKRLRLDELVDILVERHERKYTYRELEILKELCNLPGIEKTLNSVINKLRKLNQEIETPIYYKRAKKNKGEVVIVEKEGK